MTFAPLSIKKQKLVIGLSATLNKRTLATLNSMNSTCDNQFHLIDLLNVVSGVTSSFEAVKKYEKGDRADYNLKIRETIEAVLNK